MLSLSRAGRWRDAGVSCSLKAMPMWGYELDLHLYLRLLGWHVSGMQSKGTE